MRPTYRSVNKHLTLMGCDRQLMIAAMFVGFGLFVTLSSVAVGLVTFGVFAVMGRFKAKDPATLRLLMNPGGACNQYDPAKLKPFELIYIDDENEAI